MFDISKGDNPSFIIVCCCVANLEKREDDVVRNQQTKTRLISDPAGSKQENGDVMMRSVPD